MREGWSYKKLGEVCAPKKDIQRANKCFSKDEEIQYIDISSLDNSIQKITGTSLYIFKDAPSRAQQCVKKGDILVSLVRPNLKNIAIVESGSNNLVASSGFCVLRESSTIDKSFLFYFINSDKTTHYLCSLTAGANYPAIREEDIRGCIIGVPPLTTQQQIVSELDLLSHILDQKRQQLKEYDALAESIFYDMFGDPVENPKGWEVKKVSDLGIVKIGPFGSLLHASDYISGGIPLVNPIHMKDGHVIVDTDFTISESMAKTLSNYLLKANDIVLARRGDIGRCAVISEKEDGYICGTGSLFIRPGDLLTPVYSSFLVQTKSMKEYLISQAQGVTMLNINCKIVENLLFPLPPLSLQRSFAAKIESIEHQKQLLRASIKETEMLFQSRMDYWFNV